MNAWGLDGVVQHVTDWKKITYVIECTVNNLILHRSGPQVGLCITRSYALWDNILSDRGHFVPLRAYALWCLMHYELMHYEIVDCTSVGTILFSWTFARLSLTVRYIVNVLVGIRCKLYLLRCLQYGGNSLWRWLGSMTEAKRKLGASSTGRSHYVRIPELWVSRARSTGRTKHTRRSKSITGLRTLWGLSETDSGSKRKPSELYRMKHLATLPRWLMVKLRSRELLVSRAYIFCGPYQRMSMAIQNRNQYYISDFSKIFFLHEPISNQNMEASLPRQNVNIPYSQLAISTFRPFDSVWCEYSTLAAWEQCILVPVLYMPLKLLKQSKTHPSQLNSLTSRHQYYVSNNWRKHYLIRSRMIGNLHGPAGTPARFGQSA